MDNRQLYDLKQFEAGMTDLERREFEQYFVGALSVSCDIFKWNEALLTATRCFNKARNAEDK